MKTLKQIFLECDSLTESSISAIWKLNNEYDCGCMTAFRKARDGGEGEPYTRNEKLQMNKSLKAKILAYGFRVIKLMGEYPEAGVLTKEEAFFIVDDKELGLFDKLKEWGEEFEQDSILFAPKGSILGMNKAFLYGTNHYENNWLGYGNKKTFELGKMGKESPIYTSYYQGRPFIFYDAGDLKEEKLPNTGYGMWFLLEMANKKWKDIPL